MGRGRLSVEDLEGEDAMYQAIPEEALAAHSLDKKRHTVTKREYEALRTDDGVHRPRQTVELENALDQKIQSFGSGNQGTTLLGKQLDRSEGAVAATIEASLAGVDRQKWH